ncbi:BREX-3 system phosphatase PglZ [Desulfobacter sp.]
MSDWRALILDCFAPDVNALSIVTDPDMLFSEEKLVSQLKDKGFDLIEFKDSVEFRFFYESNYRKKEESGNDLIVVLKGSRAKLDLLPYDLLATGKTFHFSLSDIFSDLNYSVLQQIDRQHLDVLFNARKLNQERMGENATKDFILRHVFKISAELISTDIDLLQMLLRLHYKNLSLPEILSRRLIDVLNSLGKFQQWPLDDILADEQAFYAFLQERWPIFLDVLKAQPHQISENMDQYGLKFSGPGILPFGHQDILVYIDNLFVERKLQPVIATSTKLNLTSWIKTGVRVPKKEDKQNRLPSLLDILEKQLPSEQSRHSDWTSFALKKAEFEALRLKGNRHVKDARLNELENKIDANFSLWFEKHFPSLMSLPPTHPVMLHHIPRQMARYVDASNNHRVALIVVDGLSLDQWVTVRENLESQLFLHGKNLTPRETGVFAWIPSLTSISRQALFSGKPPLYFQGSIHSTHNEKKLWQQFWENYGLPRFDVGFKKSLGNGDPVTVLDADLVYT